MFKVHSGVTGKCFKTMLILLKLQKIVKLLAEFTIEKYFFPKFSHFFGVRKKKIVEKNGCVGAV
jgi:hypothetical protein